MVPVVCVYRPLLLTGRTLRCLNLASYNYLGFGAQDHYCTPRVKQAMQECGVAGCSSRMDAGEGREAATCVKPAHALTCPDYGMGVFQGVLA